MYNPKFANVLIHDLINLRFSHSQWGDIEAANEVQAEIDLRLTTL